MPGGERETEALCPTLCPNAIPGLVWTVHFGVCRFREFSLTNYFYVWIASMNLVDYLCSCSLVLSRLYEDICNDTWKQWIMKHYFATTFYSEEVLY